MSKDNPGFATLAIHAVGESSVPWAPRAFSITEDTQR